MARYIDLDKLLKVLEDELKDKNPNDIAYLVFKLFIGRLSQEPTADVAPRAEVAREIFEEIDSIRDKTTAGNIMRLAFFKQLAGLKRKYTEE